MWLLLCLSVRRLLFFFTSSAVVVLVGVRDDVLTWVLGVGGCCEGPAVVVKKGRKAEDGDLSGAWPCLLSLWFSLAAVGEKRAC